jgi:hypothetical protein
LRLATKSKDSAQLNEATQPSPLIYTLGNTPKALTGSNILALLKNGNVLQAASKQNEQLNYNAKPIVCLDFYVYLNIKQKESSLKLKLNAI